MPTTIAPTNTVNFDIVWPNGDVRGQASRPTELEGGAALAIAHYWDQGYGIIPRSLAACRVIEQVTAAQEEWL